MRLPDACSPSGDNGLESTRIQVRNWVNKRDACTPLTFENEQLSTADAELTEALRCSQNSSEPLARLVHGLGLEPAEFRLVVLALGPELDIRNQNWITLLLDDPGRRVGTLGLYEELLGLPSRIASDIGRLNRLARWRIFEGARDVLPAADAPIRLDAPLRGWLLGDPDALQHDGALEAMLRNEPWAGHLLVADEYRARSLVERLAPGNEWLILAGDGGPSAWRALLEAGAMACGTKPVRANLRFVATLNASDAWDAGLRLARLARLSGRPLMLDASDVEVGVDADAALTLLLRAVGSGRRGTRSDSSGRSGADLPPARLAALRHRKGAAECKGAACRPEPRCGDGRGTLHERSRGIAG